MRLVRSGIEIGGEVVPLLAAAVHYFRLDPAHWRSVLESVRRLGFRLVDTYVPWSEHETAPGEFDLGGGRPALDVARFLEIAREVGLLAIVRPGPHVNAELTCFGIPERVVWTPECQARSPRGKAVILPAPPLAFPVPSYASEAFHAEAAQWLHAVGRVLAPLCWPRGPVVLVQVDNEASMYFRDGVYDQDYHPDAISRYRKFLQRKYRRIAVLREAHGDPKATFAQSEPPRRLDAVDARDLTLHLDWAEFQEDLIARALSRMKAQLRSAGLEGVPTSHNLPPAESVSALDPTKVARAVELVGVDLYHGASARHRSEIARRVTEIAVRAEARRCPAYASELAAGFPPFLPPLSHQDNAFAALTALAYGIRGFNVYMAVDRDRWVGAPLDRTGSRRPGADLWEALLRAVERTRFHELFREASVRIVVPRVLRRLERITHAFGPVTAAAVRLLGGEAADGSFEDDFGFGESTTIAAAGFLDDLAAALESHGVAYDLCGDDHLGHALDEAEWVVVVCPGALDARQVARITDHRPRAALVSVGPRPPEWDTSMLPLERAEPISVDRPAALPRLLGSGRAALSATVEQAVATLALPTLQAEPATLAVTLHVDAHGRPAVMFVINPTGDDLTGRVAIRGLAGARDALDETSLAVTRGGLEVSVPARSVRMLALEADT